MLKLQAIKMHRDPEVRNIFGLIFRWVVTLVCFLLGKEPHVYLLDLRLSGHQSRCGWSGEGETPCLYWDSNPHLPSRSESLQRAVYSFALYRMMSVKQIIVSNYWIIVNCKWRQPTLKCHLSVHLETLGKATKAHRITGMRP
jgi:hypothetical protein